MQIYIAGSVPNAKMAQIGDLAHDAARCGTEVFPGTYFAYARARVSIRNCWIFWWSTWVPRVEHFGSHVDFCLHCTDVQVYRPGKNRAKIGLKNYGIVFARGDYE